MQRAIRVRDDLSVIVTFETRDAMQLTPSGLQNVTETVAFINNANGLRFISGGSAIRQPEDTWERDRGFKLALGRALRDSFFTKEERSLIFQTLLKALDPMPVPSSTLKDVYPEGLRRMMARSLLLFPTVHPAYSGARG